MATVDKREAFRRAQRAMQSNRPAEALTPLWSLVDRSHLVDEELHGYLRLLAQAYSALGRNRAAATVHLFLDEGPAPAPPENPGRPSRLSQATAALVLVLGLSGLGAIAAPIAEASGGETPAFYCSLHIIAPD